TSFTFFTLSLAVIVYSTEISPDTVRIIAITLLILFGLAMIFAPHDTLSNGFFSGVIFGIVLGFLWSFWVGPFKGLPDYYEPRAVDSLLIYVTSVFALAASLPVLLGI